MAECNEQREGQTEGEDGSRVHEREFALETPLGGFKAEQVSHNLIYALERSL